MFVFCLTCVRYSACWHPMSTLLPALSWVGLERQCILLYLRNLCDVGLQWGSCQQPCSTQTLALVDGLTGLSGNKTLYQFCGVEVSGNYAMAVISLEHLPQQQLLHRIFFIAFT